MGKGVECCALGLGSPVVLGYPVMAAVCAGVFPVGIDLPALPKGPLLPDFDLLVGMTSTSCIKS